MTTDELNTIVAAVVAELEKSGVDFDYKAEQAKDDDLVFVIRGTAPNYQGVTVTWKGLLDIITAQATQAKTDAVNAKDIAQQILTQVQNKGSEITNFVATSKTEIAAAKTEAVNAVKSVYQTDLNELKGDLDKIVNDQTVFGLVDGEYITPSDGVIVKSTGWSRTEYIECDQYDRLLITSNHLTVYNCFYDSDKVKIKSFYINVGENNIQVPTNAKYFILSDKTEYLKNIAIKDLRHSNGKDIDTALLLIDKISKNEFPFNIIKYEYVSKNGDFIIDTSWARSNYIDISSFKNLVINTEKSSEYNVFLDEYKSVISSFIINVGENNITIPNGAKYIIISNTIEKLGSTKINSYLSQFIEEKEIDKKNTKLVELSANLFDKNSDNIIANSNISTNGIISSDDSSLSDFIPVISGKRYTTMYINKEWTMVDGEYDYSNSYEFSRNYVAFYGENKNFIGVSNAEPYQAPLIPSDCKYIRVAFKTNKIDTFMVIPDHINNLSCGLYADYEPSNIVDIKYEVFNNSTIKGIARLGYNVTGIDTPPQHTIESFDLACEYGFDVLLADLAFTSDNVAVCFHDHYIGSSYPDIPLHNDGTLIDNSDHSITIASYTYQQWNDGYDFGLYKGEKYKGTKLLTVEEFVKYCKAKGKMCYLECKVRLTNEQVEIVANILKKYNMQENVTVATDTSITNINAMVYLETLCPKLKRVAFMPQQLTDNSKYAFSSVKKNGVEVVWFGWAEHNLTTEEVNYLIENDISYETGTFDTTSAILKWLNTAENMYCTGVESARIPANIVCNKNANLLN